MFIYLWGVKNEYYNEAVIHHYISLFMPYYDACTLSFTIFDYILLTKLELENWEFADGYVNILFVVEWCYPYGNAA